MADGFIVRLSALVLCEGLFKLHICPDVVSLSLLNINLVGLLCLSHAGLLDVSGLARLQPARSGICRKLLYVIIRTS